MSIVQLKIEIDKKAQEEIEKITESAKTEAEKILAEASAKAEAHKIEKAKALERELEAEERTELATSRMDRKAEILRLKSGLCESVFEEAKKKIAEIAKAGGREYRELLNKLTLEGIAALNGTKFVVQASSTDTETLKKDLKVIQEKAATSKNGEVVLRVENLSGAAMGGVIVSLEDGTRSFNNLLEARFAGAKRDLTGNVYKVLFEGEES
jgi:vacuolar-type H+-ATPase subunit E/Vma4